MLGSPLDTLLDRTRSAGGNLGFYMRTFDTLVSLVYSWLLCALERSEDSLGRSLKPQNHVIFLAKDALVVHYFKLESHTMGLLYGVY